MNVDFINPFLASTSNVLSTMAMLESNAGSASVRPDSAPLGDVTGIIQMSSPETRGTLALSFSEESILSIYKAMMGEEVQSITEDVTDLVGELTNMVTGGAKHALAEKGYDFDMATPRVISGKDEPISHLKGTAVIIIPFTTDHGSFYVEMCFDKLH